jgi:hypothetical protein
VLFKNNRAEVKNNEQHLLFLITELLGGGKEGERDREDADKKYEKKK